MALLHMSPRTLLTMHDRLKTSETNKNVLTASCKPVPAESMVVCSIVAVTDERNVATVIIVRRYAMAICWSARMVGIPGSISYYMSTPAMQSYD